MTRRTPQPATSSGSPAGESGQALVLVLGVVAAVLVGVLVLAAFGQALGAKSRHQRGADLAAMSAAATMKDAYPRLFEPPVLRGGVPNPRHLSESEYRGLAVAAALRAGRRNGVPVRPTDVAFPGSPVAPTRVRVQVRGRERVRVEPGRGERARREVAVEATATAELSATGAGLGMPDTASGGGYSGPLAYRQGKPMRPDVAQAFDRMAAAADGEAGVSLLVVSGFRSDAEQARLFAANPDPRWVARPGQSLHRNATELDLGPDAAYGWLAANAGRFGFLKRYSWEPWHFGYTRSPGSTSLGYGRPAEGGRSAIPAFVPAQFRAPLSRSAQRWSVGAALLAAQIQVESGFDPTARSPAGALGIAQFMPATAAAYGLSNPFDPVAAIDAQAHLMRDLLGQFGSVPLALAAYNAGPAAVAQYGAIPPYAETRAYVARILAMLGGVGDIAPPSFEVRLVA